MKTSLETYSDFRNVLSKGGRSGRKHHLRVNTWFQEEPWGLFSRSCRIREGGGFSGSETFWAGIALTGLQVTPKPQLSFLVQTGLQKGCLFFLIQLIRYQSFP
ncbi:hypothetical protein CRENBAI_011683 [Crenichthys baileyi]|uniref:Uncharacterized protein n=1 Tax=Crenichthys baileyi TaxID=28760 RepID=A0AAV9SCK7_9TELE